MRKGGEVQMVRSLCGEKQREEWRKRAASLANSGVRMMGLT